MNSNKTNEWIELGLPFDSREQPSFNGLRLNNPGTIIKTDSGVFLIGDINTRGGACECCNILSDDEIVIRYKKIWDPEEEEDL
jgi:hypothetical protein